MVTVLLGKEEIIRLPEFIQIQIQLKIKELVNGSK